MRFGIREIIFALVLIAVPTVAYMSVFRPHADRMDLQQAEIDKKQAQLVQLERVQGEIGEVGRAIEEGRELIRMIYERLPTEEAVEEILEQVWQATAGNGLTVKSVKADKTVDGSFFKELPLSLVVEGDFDGFYRFLLELENLPRITRVHEMTLTRIDPTNNNGRPAGSMKAEFTLSIYFQPSTGGLLEPEEG